MDRRLAIYPTARKVEEVLRTLSAGASLLGHRVMAFPHLVDRLWREASAADGRLSIGETGERIAVAEAMSRANTALSRTRIAADHIAGVIRQFKSAAIEPRDLEAALGTDAADASASDARADRLRDLAAIYRAYEQILAEQQLADSHDRERAVLATLHAVEDGGKRPAVLAGVERILVAEIYDFSLLQFMIVASIIRIVGDAELTIQASPHAVDAGRFAELTWNRFVSEESIADRVLPAFVRRDGRPGRLGHVLENLFEVDPAAPPAPDDTVEIACAPSRIGEVEEAARAIRREMDHARDGIEPARIAILARDLTPYGPHLEAVFERYGIPLDLSYAPAMLSAAPARLVIELARAPIDGFQRGAIVAILRSPHLAAPAGAHARFAAQAMNEIGYIDEPTRPFAECLAKRLGEMSKACDAESAGDARERLTARMERLERDGARVIEFIEMLAPLGEAATLAGHLARMRKALGAMGFDPGRGERVDDAARAGGAIRAVLDELERCAALGISERAISAGDFADLLESAFAAAPLEAPGGRRTGVRALPILDARGLDFDLVFILGLDDRTFPHYHAEDPLIPDKLKLKLNPRLAAALRSRFGARAPTNLSRILRTRSDRNAEEPLLFFLALSMPARRLVLSFAAAEGGNPLVRSPFIDEVRRTLGGELAQSRIAAAGSVAPQGERCWSRADFLARIALDGITGDPRAELIADRTTLDSIRRRGEIERARENYLALPTREEYREFSTAEDVVANPYRSHPEKLARAGRYDGRVASGSALRLMLAGSPLAPANWSASKLNELAACGFKFFASRIMRLAEEDDGPDYAVTALESGGIVHAILARLSSEIDFRNEKSAARAARATLEAIRLEQRAMARDPGFFDAQWESVERIVRAFVKFEVELRAANPDINVEAEREFALALANDRATLELRGRIDRLESYRGARGLIRRLRVLDYKTARNANRYAKMANPDEPMFGHTEFQLPVYLMATLSEFGGRLAPDAEIEAGFMVLRNRAMEQSHRVERIVVDPAMRAEARATGIVPIADRTFALVEEAAAGRFDVDPRRCDQWCPFRIVCRYDKGGLRDPADSGGVAAG